MKIHSSKRGTIGYAVDKLVKKYGHYPAGLSILALAVEKASGARSVTFSIEGQVEPKGLTSTPGWKAAAQEEAIILNELRREQAQKPGVNVLENAPEAACPLCGGWTSMGGMKNFRDAVFPSDGRTGCICNRSYRQPNQ